MKAHCTDWNKEQRHESDGFKNILTRVIKSNDSSSRRPRLDPRIPHGSCLPLQFGRDLTLSSGLCGHCIHAVHRCIWRQSSLVYEYIHDLQKKKNLHSNEMNFVFIFVQKLNIG